MFGLLLVLIVGAGAARAKPVRFDISETLLKKSRDNHWVALEPIFFKLSVPETRKEWLREARPFTAQQRRLLACYWYVEEIESGGHHQFFFNEGIIYPEALEGFREMGSVKVVQVMIEAKKILGLSEFKHSRQLRERLDSLPLDVFRPLDDKFGDLNSKDEIWKSLDRYVAAHRRAFRYHGTVEVP